MSQTRDKIVAELQISFTRGRLAYHLLDSQCPADAATYIANKLDLSFAEEVDITTITPLFLDLVALAMANQFVRDAHDVLLEAIVGGQGDLYVINESGDLDNLGIAKTLISEVGPVQIDNAAVEVARSITTDPSCAQKIAELKAKSPELYAFADAVMNEDGSFK